MTENLYCVFDELSGNLTHFVLASSDGLAARNILMTLQVPLKDTKLLCLGSYTKDSIGNAERYSLSHVHFDLKNVRTIPWTVYKFPESVSEALSPLGLSDDEVDEIKSNIEEK